MVLVRAQWRVIVVALTLVIVAVGVGLALRGHASSPARSNPQHLQDGTSVYDFTSKTGQRCHSAIDANRHSTVWCDS